jgi:hypothetical protein
LNGAIDCLSYVSGIVALMVAVQEKHLDLLNPRGFAGVDYKKR